MRTIRMFLSSPGDTVNERNRVTLAVNRLNEQFKKLLHIETIRYEDAYYRAHQPFQAQIPETATCDIVIGILANRLGTKLDADTAPRMADGEPYPSGTAYELLTAIGAAGSVGRPDVYVFRVSRKLFIEVGQDREYEEASLEAKRLDAFLATWFKPPNRGWVRAYHTVASTDVQTVPSPDEFFDAIDGLLRWWIARNVLPAVAADWRVEIHDSPFRSLQSFGPQHAAVYFGRDRHVTQAADAILRAAGRADGRWFLLIVGPSGSGKSSLMSAGLLPRLTAPGAVELPRLGTPGTVRQTDTVDAWRVAIMRPGSAPLTALAQALFATGAEKTAAEGYGPALPELAAGSFKTTDSLRSVLTADAAAATAIVTALDVVAANIRAGGGYDRPVWVHLLLLVDQFEELFAAVPDDESTAFARLLLALSASGRVWVVATLRADLYGSVIGDALLLELKDKGGQYDLASPGDAELVEILRKSAEAAGLEYEQDKSTGERLDDRLHKDAAGEGALPLLQFVLQKLFEKREIGEKDGRPVYFLTWAAYKALEGLAGAINIVADDAVKPEKSGLSEAELSRTLPRLIRGLAVPVRDHGTATTGQRALTVQAAPLAEIVRDDPAMRRLVDALREARILMASDDTAGQVASADTAGPETATLRIAHERVLTSWNQARTITKESDEFFRIRDEVQGHYKHWIEGGQKRDRLLAPGSPVSDAEKIRRKFASELPEPLVDFIDASSRHAKWKQTFAFTLAGVFGVLALVACSLGLLAYFAERESASNYQAAKTAADRLVTAITDTMQDVEGINSKTLDSVFDVVSGVIDGIRAKVQDSQSGWMRHAHDTLVAGLSFVGMTDKPTDETAALELSRGKMLLEFAETYHKSRQASWRATDMAEDSRIIFEQLDRTDPVPADVSVNLARAHQEIADLARQRIDDQDPPHDYAPVREHLKSAAEIWEKLAAQDPRNITVLLGKAQVLTRLADLDARDKTKLAVAADGYDAARKAGTQAFLLAPEDTEAVRGDPGHKETTKERVTRELGWSYRKVGESQLRLQNLIAARDAFTNEICIRRHLAAVNPDNTLWRQDLAWSLTKLSGALSQLGTPPENGRRDAEYEAALIRRQLAQGDRAHLAWAAEEASSLEAIAGLERSAGDTVRTLAFDEDAAGVRARILRLAQHEEAVEEANLLLTNKAGLQRNADVDAQRREAAGRVEKARKRVDDARKRLDEAQSRAGRERAELGAAANVVERGGPTMQVTDTLLMFKDQGPSALVRSAQGCWERLTQSFAAAN